MSIVFINILIQKNQIIILRFMEKKKKKAIITPLVCQYKCLLLWSFSLIFTMMYKLYTQWREFKLKTMLWFGFYEINDFFPSKMNKSSSWQNCRLTFQENESEISDSGWKRPWTHKVPKLSNECSTAVVPKLFTAGPFDDFCWFLSISGTPPPT